MISFDVRSLGETTSTNDEVRRMIEQGAPEGLVVRALRQTGGYGRQGRAWASPEGGLYLSMLLRPPVPALQLPTLSLVGAVAVRDALAPLVDGERAADIKVKWPNDLVASPSVPASHPGSVGAAPFGKLCGISLEAHAGAVCMGFGVNVFAAPSAERVPFEGKYVPVYLEDLGFDGPLDDVADAVLRAFEPCYASWCEAGFAPFVQAYRDHAALAGRHVRIANQAGDAVAEGSVETVDALGRLVVRTPDGAFLPVSSGEAHLV